MPTSRETPTGRTLRLVDPGEADRRAAEIADEVAGLVREAWELASRSGDVSGVCVLVVGPGGVEILNTVPDLGDLALARDELSDMVDDARRGVPEE